MKVYIVIKREWDRVTIKGVFDSKVVAEHFRDNLGGGDVEEHDIQTIKPLAE
jgi:hypothetical protein